MYIVRIFILTSSFLVLFLGCNSCSNESRFEDSYSRSLEISKQNLPSGLIDHFPLKIHGTYNIKSNYPNNNYFRRYYGTLLINYVSTDIIESNIEFKILPDSIKINPYDTCIFVIKEAIDYRLSQFNIECGERLSVIPDIESFFENNTKRVTTQDNFSFYLIESGKGELIDQAFLNAIPEELSFIGHGYSKGVAINYIDNIIVYWGIVW